MSLLPMRLDIASESVRRCRPTAMSNPIAIGQAMRMLCPQTISHVALKPNSRKVNTPESTVDMNPDITNEATIRLLLSGVGFRVISTIKQPADLLHPAARLRFFGR